MVRDQCDPSTRRTRKAGGDREETGVREGAFPSVSLAAGNGCEPFRKKIR